MRVCLRSLVHATLERDWGLTHFVVDDLDTIVEEVSSLLGYLIAQPNALVFIASSRSCRSCNDRPTLNCALVCFSHPEFTKHTGYGNEYRCLIGSKTGLSKRLVQSCLCL